MIRHPRTKEETQQALANILLSSVVLLFWALLIGSVFGLLTSKQSCAPQPAAQPTTYYHASLGGTE